MNGCGSANRCGGTNASCYFGRDVRSCSAVAFASAQSYLFASGKQQYLFHLLTIRCFLVVVRTDFAKQPECIDIRSSKPISLVSTTAIRSLTGLDLALDAQPSVQGDAMLPCGDLG